MKILRYFLAVVEAGSISRAAVNLGVTQPGLSRLMRQFEQETGWDLFERGPRSLRITREGETVAREGRALLKRAQLATKRMRQEIEGGEIRVGFAPTLGRDLLQRAMARYTQRHPRVRLVLTDCDSQQMWTGLKQQTLDFILEVASPDPAFAWQPLRQRRFRVAVPAGHRLARRRKLKPGDLDGERLLLLSRAEYPGYWNKVSQYFTDEGIDARVAGEFDGIESLSLGLDAGMGLALVAEGAALSRGVRALRLDPEPEPICVAVGWLAKRRLEPWMEDFVEALKSAGD